MWYTKLNHQFYYIGDLKNLDKCGYNGLIDLHRHHLKNILLFQQVEMGIFVIQKHLEIKVII